MDDEARWSALERIFHAALALEPEQRARYVRSACGEDEELRLRVESLLVRDDSSSSADTEFWTAAAGPGIGPYRVLSKLGAGGMGDVYLALDSRLGRRVALKVLRPRFAADPERKRRFVREARAASALNHPNIVAVHDFGSDGTLDYLVMEFVAGKPLDRLIPHDGLKLKEALNYAVQVAGALACAHAAGIVHRDLKPANVLITDSGVAKVADFGLAKQVGPGEQSATLTQGGLIVGTVAYMSPEQTEGKPVDQRSDIFSFGSLLYEMVTGHRAFQRDTAASTLAAVLREEPKPVKVYAEDVPPQFAQLIERCLRKMPADRFENMNDLKAALEAVKQEAGTAVASSSLAMPLTPRRRFLWPLRAAVLVTAVAAAVLWRMNVSPPEAVLTAVPLTTYPGFESNASFAPDGEQVAFSWCKHEGAPTWLPEYLNICNIYVKQIGLEPPSRLTETTAKEFSPSWSPDGKWIAFLRMRTSDKLALVLIPQRGGRERVLHEYDLNLTESAEMPQGPYLAWTPDSRWLVCTTPAPKAWRLSLVGVDSPASHTLTNPPESSLRMYGDTAPAISPDGRVLAFSRFQDEYDLYKLRLSEKYLPQGDPVKLRSERSPNLGAAWLADGSGFVFASNWHGQDGLWLTSASNGARPRRLPFAPTSADEPAISRNGKRLVYTAYREDMNIWRVEWVPRRQPAAPVPIISSTRMDRSPAFSLDGKRVAFVSERSGDGEIWLCERDGSNPQQLTSFGDSYPDGPQWSPDGQDIAFTIFAKGEVRVGVVKVSTGAARALPIRGGGKWPSWSRDGQWLYFAKAEQPTSIWKIRPDGGGAPVQLTQGRDDDMPQASMDGKFIYYNKGYPGPLSIWRISADGGEGTKVIEGVSSIAQWSTGRDGVYYFSTPDLTGRSEMRLYESATGRTRKIMTVERNVGFRIAVSPDGRTIFYPQIDDQGSDLMLVENFR